MSLNTSAEILKQNDVTIISFAPQYDGLNTQDLANVTAIVREVTKSADPPMVVFDLSNTNYFGSDFLSILFQGWRTLDSRKGAKCAFGGLNSYATKVFTVAQFDKIWKTFPTRDEAVRALMENDD